MNEKTPEAYDALVAKRERIWSMTTHELIEEIGKYEPDPSGLTVTVDADLLNQLRKTLERQMHYICYSGECAAATIEGMPKSWSKSTRSRFVALAENALAAVQGRFMPRNPVLLDRAIPLAVSRLETAIQEAKTEAQKPVEIEGDQDVSQDSNQGDAPRG